MLAWIGLVLAFASALVTNTAYAFEHDAAAALPPLSPRRPFRSVRFLVDDRRWLKAFGTETTGWLMYVAALRLAPLALVQSVTASGVAVLAFVTARGHPSRLARREQFAVILALTGRRAGRATLLVRAVDDILGTHKLGGARRGSSFVCGFAVLGGPYESRSRVNLPEGLAAFAASALPLLPHYLDARRLTPAAAG